MTVGCIRWCLQQGAQRKMRNGIVDIKVFSAALPMTAVALISHYPSADYLPIQRARSLSRDSELAALATSPLTVATMTGGMLTAACWFRNITPWLYFKTAVQNKVFCIVALSSMAAKSAPQTLRVGVIFLLSLNWALKFLYEIKIILSEIF